MKKTILSIFALAALGASTSAFAQVRVGAVSGWQAEIVWNDLDKGGVRTVEMHRIMTKDVGRLHCERRNPRRGGRDYNCELRAPEHWGQPGWNDEHDGNDAEIFFALSDAGEWGPIRTTGPLQCVSRFHDNSERWGGAHHGAVRPGGDRHDGGRRDGGHRWGGHDHMPNWAKCWFN